MYQNIYNYFKEISKIPRGTYNIDEISNYLVEFAKKRNLKVIQDESKNVLITKEASNGYEDKEPIIIQAHMDMVCQKDEDSNHDFLKDGIEIIEENGYLKANKTTLGADNGIGVSIILTLLDEDINSPKIEALFTVNEEGGMEGARDLDINLLEGKRLINIDSETEGVITVGCAGGTRVEVSYQGKKEELEGDIITLKVFDLLGGHSGVDIDKNRVNAIKLIGKILNNLDDINLLEINGGEIDNAICHSCLVKFITTNNINIDNLKNDIEKYLKEHNEEEAKVEISKDKFKGLAFTTKSTKDIINYLNQVLNGVVAYEEGLDKVVKTSLNFGIIKTNMNNISCCHSIRSSLDSERELIVSRIKELADSINAQVEIGNSYSGWAYNSNSKLTEYMLDKYKELFNKDMIVEVIHAGLECGLFVAKRKNLDCVSIGPTIYNPHTPKEELEIESANNLYDYLIKVLKDID